MTEPAGPRNHHLPGSMRDNMLTHICCMLDSLSTLSSELLLLMNLVKGQQHSYALVVLVLIPLVRVQLSLDVLAIHLVGKMANGWRNHEIYG